jgi:hypothetical protein
MSNSEIENFYHFELNCDSTCKTCGETYQNPLYATVFSENHKSEFYACPRCLSELKHTRKNSNPEKIEEEGLAEQKTEVKLEAQSEENLTCTYGFGHLRRRQKSTAIPDQCLTCTKMIDCM